MTYIVTGAAGFVGANIVRALNARGEKNIIAVDDLRPADKYRNLADLDIADYIDKNDFLEGFDEGWFGKVKAVFHEGPRNRHAVACHGARVPSMARRACFLLHAGARLECCSPGGGHARPRRLPS